MQTPLEPQVESQRVATVPEGGTPFAIQVTPLSSKERDIISEPVPFKEVTDSIESIARAVLATLQRVKPQKATVEFGIEIAASEGQLLAVVAKGDAKANLRIVLEWGENLPTEIQAIEGEPS